MLLCSVATFSINSSWIPQPQPEQIVDSSPNRTEMGGHNEGSGQKWVGLAKSEEIGGGERGHVCVCKCEGDKGETQ